MRLAASSPIPLRAAVITVLALACSIARAYAAPEHHRVKWLPGLQGVLTSELYSGYLVGFLTRLEYQKTVGIYTRTFPYALWLSMLCDFCTLKIISCGQVTGEHHVHYMLAESAGEPSKDPLVLWLNGGPGSSSLIGFFQELGPVVVASKDSLVVNPYAWNLFANVLFLETPTGRWKLRFSVFSMDAD